MNKFEFDIPVALIFFNRPQTFHKVFEKVKKVRPKQLFLIQDGARPGNKHDTDLIADCRKIAENIDWECEVYKDYSKENLGCGIRPYTGVNFVFNHVDRAIILEDDCVPTDSFFNYCKEMLERYQDDKRIGLVSGFNYFNEYFFDGNSYGFVKSGSISGWATWKDRWQQYDYTISGIEKPEIVEKLLHEITPKTAAKRRVQTWRKARRAILKTGRVSFWDYQWGFTRHVNSWLSIVPQYSQITNIGVGNGATHSANSIKHLPSIIAAFFFMSLTELSFPLKHPETVTVDKGYDKAYYKIVYPNYVVKNIRRAYKLISRLIRN